MLLEKMQQVGSADSQSLNVQGELHRPSTFPCIINALYQGGILMLDRLNFVAKVLLIVVGTAAIVAFIAFSPMIFCHGGGAGGNCGEGLLASLPLAMVLGPAILVLGIVFFFRSTAKVLLPALALVAIAAAIPGIVGNMLGTAERRYLRNHPTERMQDNALRSYKHCLDIIARGRAQFSEDQPSAIERLSLDKCARERTALFDEFQISPVAVANVEVEFQINLPQLMESQRQKFPAASGHRG